MKLQEVLTKTTQFFRDKNFHSPRLDAELILAHGLGIERIQLYLKFDQPLNDQELQTCRELVRRRVAGEPVAYILGYRDFYGHRFIVNNSTLIPRPETEHLVEEAVNWIRSNNLSNPKIVDLGTGTGCVGLSILKELPEATLVSVDVSAAAIEVAQKNAIALGVHQRVVFVNEDAGVWLQKTDNFGQFDAVVSNPPYIATSDVQVEEMVKKYEPHSALFAADDGLALLKDWSRKALDVLKVPGVCIMEMGSTQAVQMLNTLESLTDYKEVRVIKDLSGHDRLIFGVKNNG